jgi:hypothetical protein
VKSVLSGILAITLSVFLVITPVSASSKDFVGVGTASGSALINGIEFSSGSNLYSSDRVQTRSKTNFLLSVAPDERVALSPDTFAQLRSEGGALVVGLERGKVVVQSAGRTRISLDQLGIMVKNSGASPALAEVTILGAGHAQVSALRGSLEITGASKPLTLLAGQGAMLTDASMSMALPPPAPAPPGFGGGNTHDIAIFVFVLAVASTASFFAFSAAHSNESPSKP